MMAGGESPGPGGQSKSWHQCLVDDLRVFRATEGSTEHSPLVFGVETALWPMSAKKAGNWYRGVLEAAEQFMVRWHENEAKVSRKRHASVMGGVQRNGKGMGKSRRETAVDESKEMADRVVRYQTDSYVREPVYASRAANFCGCFECDLVVLWTFSLLFCRNHSQEIRLLFVLVGGQPVLSRTFLFFFFSMCLGCCNAYVVPVVSGTMACPRYLQYEAVSLCRSFVATERSSL